MTPREKFIVLVDNDLLKKSDAIVLLEGDGVHRVDATVELYKQGWAPRIVFSGGSTDLDYGSYPSSMLLPLLKEAGVPGEHIITETNSLNTFEQSIEVVKLAKEQRWSRLLLVASHYHQYRVYLTFIKTIYDIYPGLEVINAPARNLAWFTGNTWGTRYELLETEFQKIESYSTHMASIEQAIEYQQWKEQRP